jgi:F-type H+-transporting ATPase subunit c
MRHAKLFFLICAVILLAASPVLAQGGAAPAPTNWKPVGAAIGMAIASGLCGLGQGRATAGAAEGMARNPGATAAIRFALILGLALIESLALYTLVIILIT